MLSVNKAYEANIDFLLKDLNKDLGDLIKYPKLNMDSDLHNTTFNNIEKELNSIYEKLRILEDITNYSKEYITTQIHTYSEDFNETLRKIEDKRDGLKKSAYISYVVPFSEGLDEKLDRDFTVIKGAEIHNGIITLSSEVMSTAKIVNIENILKSTTYKNNLKDFLLGKNYRTMYLLDNPLLNGLIEELYVTLDKPTKINNADIITSNCDIEKVEYIYDNGAIETANDYVNSIDKERTIKALKLYLISNYYKKKTYQIDELRINENFWDRVKDKEYNSITGNAIEDIELEDSLNAYKEDYKKYIDELIIWQNAKEKYLAKNKEALAKYEEEYQRYLIKLKNWEQETGKVATPVSKEDYMAPISIELDQKIELFLNLDKSLSIKDALLKKQKEAEKWLTIKDTAEMFDITLINEDEETILPIGGTIIK